MAASGIRDIMKGAWITVKEFPRMGKMAASVKRIQDLEDTFDELDYQYFRRCNTTKCPLLILKETQKMLSMPSTPISSTRSEGSPRNAKPEVILQNCSLTTPSGQPLVQNLNLVVDRGTSVIIIGPSGVGKSSLLRAIAGLWEPTSGNISLPGNHTPMFLPQNVYIPDIPLEDNTLQMQLLFPREGAQAIYQGECLVRVLKMVNLGRLVKPEHGILTTGKWREQLSGGEKQRLAMARLLIARPKIAFLDESTSALDPENERRLYKELQSRKATYIRWVTKWI